ncbi:MAG: chloride channel protein [Acidobacteriia bacterium]|nr:chloride channel protein [Terriglobia bacterium]
MIRVGDLGGWLQTIRHRFRTNERAYALALVLSAGVLGALGAVLVRFGGLALQYLAFASKAHPLDVARGLRFPMVVIAPAAGGLAAGLLARYFVKGGSSGEGTSEIMEAVSLRGAGQLHLGRTLRKSLASVLLNATGGSVGREGPIVQIGAAAASRLGRILRIPTERRRILIGCGVASGMAAAYNAPIGAALFVMEVIHGNFALDVFGPVVLASITATLLSRGVIGATALYQVAPGHAPGLLSLPLFAVLGALIPLVALLLRSSVEAAERIFRRVPVPVWARTGLGGLAVGLLAWWIPEVWGNGYDAVSEVLMGNLLPKILLPLLLAKIVATAASIGSGGSGGVFTPTLLVGAAGGALFAAGAHAALPGLQAEAVYFTLGGMAAAIASTTFAPITALIMVFEMCQDYGAVMPLAVAVVTATALSRTLRRDSIYTEALRRRGVDFDLAFEQMALASLRAEDFIRLHPLTVRADAPMGEVVERFTESRATAIYVLDAEDRLKGAIDLRDAFQVAGEPHLKDSLVALDLVRDVPRVTKRTPLDEVMRRFSQLELAQLPVVDQNAPDRLVGSVARRDVVQALDREVLRRRLVLAQYLGGNVPGEEAGARRAADLRIEERPAPALLVGRSLLESDPYHALGLYVLAVKRPEGSGVREISPAPPDLVVREGDALVLLGPAGAFEALEQRP